MRKRDRERERERGGGVGWEGGLNREGASYNLAKRVLEDLRYVFLAF